MVEPFEEYEDREPTAQIAGRIVGILVFIAGIVLLGIVFATAYHAFQDPKSLIPELALNSTPPVSPQKIYVSALVRLILLFAMGYFASLIAARGAQFFFSSKREVRRGPIGD